MEYMTYSNIGLALDIIGATILFFRGFPVSIDMGSRMGKDGPVVKTHWHAKAGFILLILGFIFQLVGNIIK